LLLRALSQLTGSTKVFGSSSKLRISLSLRPNLYANFKVQIKLGLKSTAMLKDSQPIRFNGLALEMIFATLFLPPLTEVGAVGIPKNNSPVLQSLPEPFL